MSDPCRKLQVDGGLQDVLLSLVAGGALGPYWLFLPHLIMDQRGPFGYFDSTQRGSLPDIHQLWLHGLSLYYGETFMHVNGS